MWRDSWTKAEPSERTARDLPWVNRAEIGGLSLLERKLSPMFQVSVEETFSSGHALRGYKGKCENVHGHNYRVQVTLEGPQLDNIGLLLDFTQPKQVLRGIIKRLDPQFINDLEPFTAVNPSAENMAKYFYDEISSQLTSLPPGAHVTQ